jgi:hypothetical protein
MYKISTKTRATVNGGSAMGAETILKTRVTPKNQMSRGNFLNYEVIRTLLLAILILVSVTAAKAEDKGQISFSTTYSSQITSSNNFDRYTVVLPQSGNLSVNITSPGGSAALPPNGADVQWLNAGGTWLGGTSGGFPFPYSSGDIY